MNRKSLAPMRERIAVDQVDFLPPFCGRVHPVDQGVSISILVLAELGMSSNSGSN